MGHCQTCGGWIPPAYSNYSYGGPICQCGAGRVYPSASSKSCESLRAQLAAAQEDARLRVKALNEQSERVSFLEAQVQQDAAMVQDLLERVDELSGRNTELRFALRRIGVAEGCVRGGEVSAGALMDIARTVLNAGQEPDQAKGFCPSCRQYGPHAKGCQLNNTMNAAAEKLAEQRDADILGAFNSQAQQESCPCGAESSKGCSQTGCPLHLKDSPTSGTTSAEANGAGPGRADSVPSLKSESVAEGAQAPGLNESVDESTRAHDSTDQHDPAQKGGYRAD